jgi:hypothetical protein
MPTTTCATSSYVTSFALYQARATERLLSTCGVERRQLDGGRFGRFRVLDRLVREPDKLEASTFRPTDTKLVLTERPLDAMSGRSVVAGVYPSPRSRGFAREDRTPDQHDAFQIVERLRREDLAGYIALLFDPELSERERAVARLEGWILGVA